MKSTQSLEVHPGPGVNAYRSDLYTVEVQCGATWQQAYLYKVSRLSTCYGWHRGKYPSVNFLTIGASDAVRVRLTKLAGPIQGVQM